ncbi:hypothetical protein B0T22DRAFT_476342 [Podospora appendiculata]|uniref:DUF7721 domain-containing protein n=1 Tax=Podospora appendiculata TaxID=314037 RepID=A0AAE0XHG4_9PEZI|nr:hypothetical protein B0T22DRAFT_476342 [Podospora appendiculata]
MDKFLNKVLGSEDERPQKGLYQGGGNMTHGGAYPAGGGFDYPEDEDLRGAAGHAASHGGSEDSSFFSSIVSQLASSKQQVGQGDIDEEAAIRNHKQYYTDAIPMTPTSNAPHAAQGQATSSGMGSAAAMQALKMFTSGGGASGTQNQSQSAFIGLAMAQASKLFDQQASAGRVASGTDKSSAVMKAGEMALQMYLKSQGGRASSSSAGSGGSGIAGLMKMANAFM